MGVEEDRGPSPVQGHLSPVQRQGELGSSGESAPITVHLKVKTGVGSQLGYTLLDDFFLLDFSLANLSQVDIEFGTFYCAGSSVLF